MTSRQIIKRLAKSHNYHLKFVESASRSILNHLDDKVTHVSSSLTGSSFVMRNRDRLVMYDLHATGHRWSDYLMIVIHEINRSRIRELRPSLNVNDFVKYGAIPIGELEYTICNIVGTYCYKYEYTALRWHGRIIVVCDDGGGNVLKRLNLNQFRRSVAKGLYTYTGTHTLSQEHFDEMVAIQTAMKI